MSGWEDMHRWDAGTCWHLETNPIKCTYLPYTYTITVALIYNVCERRVYIQFLCSVVFSLSRLCCMGGATQNTHVTVADNWFYVGFTDPTAGAESTSLVNASDSSEHC